MKRATLAFVAGLLALGLLSLFAAPLWPAASEARAETACQAGSDGWIIWEALNINGLLFVDPASIMDADDCTCRWPCGGVCPAPGQPCVKVRRAQVAGPFCSEEEAWAHLCSSVSNAGTYVIGSPCPFWIHFNGIHRTVSWSPWLKCPKMGGDVVVPTPDLTRCSTPSATPTPTPTETPTATPTRAFTAQPTPTATEEWDFDIAAVEFTQAIQALDPSRGDTSYEDNQVVQARAKRTVIRVYPRLSAVSVPEPGSVSLSGVLYLEYPIQDEVYPANDDERIDLAEISNAPDRDRGGSSLNFRLPRAWTNFPQIRVRAELNPGHSPPETSYDNNSKTESFDFVRTSDLNVVYVPISYEPPGQPALDPDEEEIAAADYLARQIYPVRDRGLTYYAGKPMTFREPLVGGIDDDGRLRRWLNLLYFEPQVVGLARPQLLFGWLPAIGTFTAAGGADTLDAQEPKGMGRVAYGQGARRSQPRSWHILAHELAHLLRAQHPDTGDTCGAPPPPEPYWPYQTAAIQESGFRVQDPFPDIAVPAAYKDFMTYCDSWQVWVSPHHWGQLEEGISQIGAPAPSAFGAGQAPAECLLVNGTVYKDGHAELETIQLVTLADPPALPASGGPYCVVLGDAAGSPLSSFCFGADWVDHTGEAVEGEVFFYVLPAPAGASQVRLTAAGATLAERSASAHAPVVYISAPAAGADWAGTQTVRWTATDADGDALVYSIVYSHDGGQTWMPIEVDWTQNSCSFDTNQVPGGHLARIAVIANDGFLTGMAQVGPFSVPAKGPRPRILAPADGLRILPGQALTLLGEGDDPEDGQLPDEAFSWASDRDGALGTGPTLDGVWLSAGDHRITLTGRDAAGNAGAASIGVHVGGLKTLLPLILKRADRRPTATPTITATPTLSCALLFHDDFNAGGLSGWVANGGEWSNPGGRMYGWSTAGANAWTLKPATATDFIYEGTVTLLDGSAAGLTFRSTNGAQGYDLVVDIYAGQLRLYRQPTARLLASYDCDVQRGRPYALRVEARASAFDIYLDGARRITVADAAYAAGRLGVCVFNGKANFDNLSACAIQPPTPPTPTPTRTATVTATSVTPSRTPTVTVAPSPSQTATAGPVRVRLLDGDAHNFRDRPDLIVCADAVGSPPPAGVTITDSGGLWRNGCWIGMLSGGQWIRARDNGHSTAVGVQFWGGDYDGWARVKVDSVVRWEGSIYAPNDNRFIKYLEVSNLPDGPHTIRVEATGQLGAGGGPTVTLYCFGFGPAEP